MYTAKKIPIDAAKTKNKKRNIKQMEQNKFTLHQKTNY